MALLLLIGHYSYSIQQEFKTVSEIATDAVIYCVNIIIPLSLLFYVYRVYSVNVYETF